MGYLVITILFCFFYLDSIKITTGFLFCSPAAEKRLSELGKSLTKGGIVPVFGLKAGSWPFPFLAVPLPGCSSTLALYRTAKPPPVVQHVL